MTRTCSVGVNNLVSGQSIDLESSGFLRVGSSEYSSFSTLSKDDYSWLASVFSGELSNVERDSFDAERSNVVRSGIGFGFAFVAKDEVDVGHDLVELGSEELRDERCGKVERKGLPIHISSS